MKIKILKFIALLFVFAGGFSFCNKNTLDDSNIDMSNIDFSNIEDLHAQPLPVIQKCVRGKWKWFHIYRSGVLGSIPLSHTFVEFTNDSIFITQDGGDDMTVPGKFSYSWKKKKVYDNILPSSYTTYVMQYNDGQTTTGWYFDNIQNDTLGVCVDTPRDVYGYGGYLFSRIK